MKPRCRYGCTFIQISDNLFLCPHIAYGEATSKMGAVDEARALVARAGGYDAVLAREREAVEKRREEARRRSEDNKRRMAASVRPNG